MSLVACRLAALRGMDCANPKDFDDPESDKQFSELNCENTLMTTQGWAVMSTSGASDDVSQSRLPSIKAFKFSIMQPRNEIAAGNVPAAKMVEQAIAAFSAYRADRQEASVFPDRIAIGDIP